MKIKKQILQSFLSKYDISEELLADELNVELSEVKKLLNHESVQEATARKFIYYFGTDEIIDLIDWDAMGKKRPNL
ncbi:MAG: hypothetical protein NC133_02610 [Prevotella sp.]|nr:hypothetical protein [Prevotella sp.]